MGMPRQIQEAALQIIDNANDIHGALALAGRHELTAKVVKIQKSAACILKMERPGLDPIVSAKKDAVNAIGCLHHVMQRNIPQWPEIEDEEIVTMLWLAETFVKRGYEYINMVENAKREEDSPAWTMTTNDGGEDNDGPCPAA